MNFQTRLSFQSAKPAFGAKTSGLEMRIGKRKRFSGKQVDVVRGGCRRVDKDSSPIAAGKNTFLALSIDPVFSRASEKVNQTFTLPASSQFQQKTLNKYDKNGTPLTAKNRKPLTPLHHRISAHNFPNNHYKKLLINTDLNIR
ncbi:MULTISPECIES: hypothetical protein [Burkholderia]|uniref:hypothetical protein n=1 Tax=Burkholderia TaxID=32008 RepID=UPI0011806D57|nr:MULTISPECIES: hypothetical protein [Burkholderia]